MSSTARGAALLALLGASIAFGQMNTGEIAGSVQDQLGGQLAGAKVVAEQTSTGQSFTTVSNQAGEYLFAALPVGMYTLTASAVNFRSATLSPVELHAGGRLRFDFTLRV